MSDTKVQRTRIAGLIVVVALAGIFVIGRLFTLQIIDRTSYAERAEHQYVTPSGNVFDRGNIFFTSKDGTTVAAATIASGFKMAIVPAQVTDPDKAYADLNAIVPMDKADFLAKAAKKSDPYEEVAVRISDADGAKLTALHEPGVTLYRDKWRFYPGGSLAAKAIGFVSFKDSGNGASELAGSYGLEEYYNDVLSRSSTNLYVNFFAQIFANVQSTIFKNTAATGDVVTSIEPTVQAELDSLVQGVQTKWQSDSVGAVVLDPYTGAIIAMSQVPTFDLNDYASVKNIGIYSNPLAQNVYEMGSIVKPLVMAAAIDTGAVTPTTTYFDPGYVTVNGTKLNNFDKVGRGTATMQDVLNQSLNTGMVFVEQHMSKDTFRDYMLNRYKLGDKTGVDLPGEVNGRMSSIKGTNDINFATAAFGQGIATSPLNIVRGFAALANGGTMVTPHLATAIVESNGTTKTLTYPTSGPVLKPETISTIHTMLVHVVDDGYHKGLAHYTVAAKTGTAQIAKPDGAGYYNDRNLHSLIGFFPASNPKYVVYFFNVYPKNVLYAIQTLADPFFNMVQFLGNYYDIPPDR